MTSDGESYCTNANNNVNNSDSDNSDNGNDADVASNNHNVHGGDNVSVPIFQQTISGSDF